MNLRDLLMQAAGMNKQSTPQGEAPAMFNNGVLPTNRQPMQPMQPGLKVGVNRGMQLGGQFQEDDYTPSAALEQTDYFDPQTTRHGQFLHQGGYNPQTSLDSTLQQGGTLSDYIRLSNY